MLPYRPLRHKVARAWPCALGYDGVVGRTGRAAMGERARRLKVENSERWRRDAKLAAMARSRERRARPLTSSR